MGGDNGMGDWKMDLSTIIVPIFGKLMSFYVFLCLSMSFWHLRTLKGMVNSPEIWVAKRRHKADDFWKGVAKKNSGAYLQSWASSRKELSTYQAILRSYSTISTGWNRSKPELCHPLLLGQTFSYWCLAGNFREWSQSSLVIIIPATPSNPSIPYV